MISFSLPQEMIHILEKLHKNGYEAYIVGGCVRDLLLHDIALQNTKTANQNLAKSQVLLSYTPSDWDITTSALPHEVQGLFPHTIPTGLRHGTISIVGDNGVYEVTTFRTDGSYSNSRTPDSVSFVRDLKEDLKRRDFSINALAYAPHTGLIDHINGLSDLYGRRIVCVGEARIRFGEDALRILRAMRFAATLGFEIEHNTKKAMFLESASLAHISLERVKAELEKLLCGEYAGAVLGEFSTILHVVLPEISLKSSAFRFSFSALELLAHKGEVKISAWEIKNLAWVAFVRDFVGFHTPQGLESGLKLLGRLRLDKQSMRFIGLVCEYYFMDFEINEYGLRKAFVALGGRSASDEREQSEINALNVLKGVYLLHQTAQNAHHTNHKGQFLGRLISLDSSSLPLSLKELEINGRDLQNLARVKQEEIKGAKIGIILKALLDEVLQEKLENHKKALLHRANELF